MKNKYETIILGAGAGGLGTACWLAGKDKIVIEGSDSLPKNLSNGVHYLHSSPILPFIPDLKRITLSDGILGRDGSIKHSADLNDALQYSEKVREIQHPSSILEVGKDDEAYLPGDNNLNSFLEEMYRFIGSKNFVFGRWVKEINVKKKTVKV